jgi:UDP-N-acetylglucosamine acyltransferase
VGGIDPRAVVDVGATLGEGVTVDPFAIVGPDVTVGSGTRIGSGALVSGHTEIGENCTIAHGAVVGTDPQDLKYDGETTFVRVGRGTTIREFATVNRASGEGEATVIGDDCLVMAYAHVAHNCAIGDSAIIANATNLAGHVIVEDHAIVGGMTPVHQFVRIGAYSFVGGGSRVTKDVPPYFKAAGCPFRPIGINSVGLARHGFSEDARRHLRQVFRILYLSGLNTSQALARIREELPMIAEVERVLDFVAGSSRGIVK